MTAASRESAVALEPSALPLFFPERIVAGLSSATTDSRDVIVAVFHQCDQQIQQHHDSAVASQHCALPLGEAHCFDATDSHQYDNKKATIKNSTYLASISIELLIASPLSARSIERIHSMAITILFWRAQRVENFPAQKQKNGE